MSRVYRGEEFNPYTPGSTLFHQWRSERDAVELDWYRYQLMTRFEPGQMPTVGSALTGLRYGEVRQLRQRVKDLESWIKDNHHAIYVQGAGCAGVLCLTTEDDLKEILGES